MSSLLSRLRPGDSTAIEGKEINVEPTSKVQASASEKERGVSEDVGELQATTVAHTFDPNLPQERIDELNAAAQTGDPEAIRKVQEDFNDDSPYEEVRAAVRNIDGGEVANTVRAWVLGLVFVTVCSGLNMFLSMRNPAITFPPVVVLLIVYPIGCAWARVMPTRKFSFFGIPWTFNTGPFTIKEHTVITLMASISINYAYSTDALLALKGKPFYNLEMGWGFQLLFTLSSQVIGIALAGLFRRFLVWPSAMMWPLQFTQTALLYALHDTRPSDPAGANGWRISRYRFFSYVMLGSFLWYWLPGVIFQALSVFAFATWIAPNNVTVNQLFGGSTGLSLIPITFDWTYVQSYLLDPLLAPAHTHLNTLVGLVFFVIITAIGVSFTNSWYSDYLPINTATTFDNTQSTYNVTKVLGPGFTFDAVKYHNYSPMFLAPTFALNYGLSFAALTAVIVHTILFHRKEIWYRFKASRQQEPDIHMKLMKKYPEAPDWWYLVLFVLSLAMGLATALGYSSQLPWWAYFVSCIIALVFVLPTCMVYAIANIQLSLNVLAPFLAGFMIPGKPIGVMIFKVYSTNVLGQAQLYTSDLKLGHYMKVPPKTVFSCQVISALWASIVQISTMNWVLGNVNEACQPHQSGHFTCPNGRTFFSSSIVWGVIGPKRMFGPGSIYWSIHFYWLIGACLPVIFYLIVRAFPRSPARYLNAPVMLGAMGWLPPATPLSFSSWAIVGLTFNYWIKNRWHGFWHTYNYVIAAGLDTGLIIATIVIFFALTLPDVTLPQWWGNVGAFNTADAMGTAIRKTVGEGETFGPKTWV